MTGKLVFNLLGMQFDNIVRNTNLLVEFDTGTYNSFLRKSRADKICGKTRRIEEPVELWGLGQKNKEIPKTDILCKIGLKIGEERVIPVNAMVIEDSELFPPSYMENVKRRGGSDEMLFDLLIGSRAMQENNMMLRPSMSYVRDEDVERAIILPEEDVAGGFRIIDI